MLATLKTKVKNVRDRWLRFIEVDAVSPTHNNTSRLKKSLQLDAAHFSDILPYRYFDARFDIFINAHSIGFGLEVGVLTGASETIIKSLADYLKNKLPDGFEQQWVLWGSQQIGGLLDSAFSLAESESSHPMFAILNRLNRQSRRYYERAAQDSFSSELPITCRDYRLFVFVSQKPQKVQYSEKTAEKLCSVREQLCAELHALQIQSVRMDQARFLSTVGSWVNPNLSDVSIPAIPADAHETLNQQVVEDDTELLVDDEALHFSGKANFQVINLSITRYPDQFPLWLSADNIVNGFRRTQGIACPFLMSMTIAMIPKEKAKAQAQSRFLSTSKKANSVYAKYISGTVEAAEQWRQLRDELQTDDVRLAHSYFNLVLFTKPSEANKHIARAISCFRLNGFELSQIKYCQLQSFLASLPFTASEGLLQDLKRAKRTKKLTSWNIANCLPIVADPKLGDTGVLLPTFRNQTAFLNVFDPKLGLSNHNICISGTSGSGKSQLAQKLAADCLKRGGKVYVIDLGSSQQKTCELLNGVYLEGAQLRMNPFSFIDEKKGEAISDHAERIRDLLAVLASSQQHLDDIQLAYLYDAVMRAWELAKNDANIDTVVRALNEIHQQKNDRRVMDLITLLSRYTLSAYQHNEAQDSLYARIFNEASRLDPNARYTVLELGSLENKPSLLKAVLFSYMLYIEHEMYQLGSATPKMVIIDEAWRLLKGDDPAAARFIEKGFRTARKHGGSFVVIMQGIQDFLDEKNTQAIAAWNNADTKITMLQNAQGFKQLIQSKPNLFTPFAEHMIQTFREAKVNGFAECLLEVGGCQSFHRVFSDPFERVLFSTHPLEVEAVLHLKNQGVDLLAAIDQVARSRYFEQYAQMMGEQA